MGQKQGDSHEHFTFECKTFNINSLKVKRMPKMQFGHQKNDPEGRFMFKLTNLPDQSCVLFDKLDRK